MLAEAARAGLEQVQVFLLLLRHHIPLLLVLLVLALLLAVVLVQAEVLLYLAQLLLPEAGAAAVRHQVQMLARQGVPAVAVLERVRVVDRVVLEILLLQQVLLILMLCKVLLAVMA